MVILFTTCTLAIREIEVVGLCRVFRRQGINLVDRRYDAEFLTPFTDSEAGLFRFHATLKSYGSANLEIGEAVDLGFVQ